MIEKRRQLKILNKNKTCRIAEKEAQRRTSEKQKKFLDDLKKGRKFLKSTRPKKEQEIILKSLKKTFRKKDKQNNFLNKYEKHR